MLKIDIGAGITAAEIEWGKKFFVALSERTNSVVGVGYGATRVFPHGRPNGVVMRTSDPFFLPPGHAVGALWQVEGRDVTPFQYLTLYGDGRWRAVRVGADVKEPPDGVVLGDVGDVGDSAEERLMAYVARTRHAEGAKPVRIMGQVAVDLRPDGKRVVRW